MDAAELSVLWRHGRDAFLGRRRRIIALSLASVGLNGWLALYETGIIKRLPDPPLPSFDSEKVVGSAQGYAYFSTPSSALAVGSYAATLALAALNIEDGGSKNRALPLLLAAKIAFDALFSGKLAIDQWTRYRAFCLVCLASTVASLAAVPQIIPEVRAAARRPTAGR